MARFRLPRTVPRLAGTKRKHDHDSLHLIETARVKVNRARVRLPDRLSATEYLDCRQALQSLQYDLTVLEASMVKSRWQETNG